MWRNSDENMQGFISLHDCRATAMAIHENDLLFTFDDGFWVSFEDERNPFNNTVRTDKSEVQIVHFDVPDIYIFKELRIFRRLVSTKRICLSVEQLMANINCGKWELEFIYEYHSDRGVLYQCWIWMNHAPFHIECQIALDCDKTVYHWNNLCENKPW